MMRDLTAVIMLAGPVQAEVPVPAFLQDIGGAFVLQDQTGHTRTQVDPDGYAQLVFFGYANCKQICSSVLPQMAEVADVLADTGHIVRPVMITVDPLVDTVASLGPALVQYHRDFVGLTGTDAALQVAYDAFQIEKEHLFDDPEFGPVYAHGSFLYLLDAEGTVLTVIPPVLSDAEIVSIILNYVPAG